MLSTEDGVFTADVMLVPWMGWKLGAPSYWMVGPGASRFTSAVCGICASITASWAWVVPETKARTSPLAEAGGMRVKSGGSWSERTKLHGPWKEVPAYQR